MQGQIHGEKERLWFIPGVVAIALAGFAVRLYGVGHSSLRLEEAYSLLFAKNPTLIFKDFHPPVYFLVVSAWQSIFSDNLTSIHVLYALIGAISVVLISVLGKAIADAGMGLLSGMALSFFPLHIAYSKLGGIHLFASMVALASFLALIKLPNEDGSRKAAVTLGFLNAIGILATYSYIFILLVQPLFLFFLEPSRSVRKKDLWIGWGTPVVALIVASPIIYMQTKILAAQIAAFPGLATVWKAPLGSWIGDLGLGAPWMTLDRESESLGLGTLISWALSAVGALLFLAGTFFGIVRKTSRRMAVLSLFYGLLAILALVSTVFPVWSPGLLVFLIPFLCLVMALLPACSARVGIPIVSVVFLLAGLGMIVNERDAAQGEGAWMKPPAWKELAQELKGYYRAGDNLVIMPGWMGQALRYHMFEAAGLRNRRPNDIPYVIEAPYDFYDSEKGLSDLKIPESDRIWLISAEGYSSQNLVTHLEKSGFRLEGHSVYWRLMLDLMKRVPASASIEKNSP
jgi:4-amino-4-deoxy-L-arabinose transferase-like glycosyltransferase